MVDFKGSHFEREIVLWGVRWYVAYEGHGTAASGTTVLCVGGLTFTASKCVPDRGSEFATEPPCEAKETTMANNDTPYSWAWVDVRSEPWVLVQPPADKDRSA